ncbi:hypothetical protein SEA_SADLAD_84 [Microbacterium phage SadLad]|nr:hypothetical protein SEA_SADLAD_84 [Microbacterium phage SadLad]
MSTTLDLRPTEGTLTTKAQAVQPQRLVTVASETRDSTFPSNFATLSYAYAGGSGSSISILFTDIDMVVDALLEHQAARTNRLTEAITLDDITKRRNDLRAAFTARKEES